MSSIRKLLCCAFFLCQWALKTSEYGVQHTLLHSDYSLAQNRDPSHRFTLSDLLCLIDPAYTTMSLTDPSNFHASPSSKYTSRENSKPGVELTLTPDRKSTRSTTIDESGLDYSRDSVTRRRRHAVYMPRPPVWCPRQEQSKHSFPVLEGYKFPVAIGENGLSGNGSHSKSSSSCEQNLHNMCLTDNTLEAPIGRISEEQANFEQQLFCDITAAMADAQAARTDAAGSDSEDPETPLLVRIPCQYLKCSVPNIF